MNLPLKQLNLAGGDGYIGPSFPLPLQSPSPRKLPLLKFPIETATENVVEILKIQPAENQDWSPWPDAFGLVVGRDK